MYVTLVYLYLLCFFFVTIYIFYVHLFFRHKFILDEKNEDASVGIRRRTTVPNDADGSAGTNKLIKVIITRPEQCSEHEPINDKSGKHDGKTLDS